MAASETEDFREYKRLILANFERLEGTTSDQEKRINHLERQIVVLKTQAALMMALGVPAGVVIIEIVIRTLFNQGG